MSALIRSRNCSVVQLSIAVPTTAKFSESKPSHARLYIAGTSSRFVRSPEAPKMSMTHGSLVGLFVDASAPSERRTWEGSGMPRRSHKRRVLGLRWAVDPLSTTLQPTDVFGGLASPS